MRVCMCVVIQMQVAGMPAYTDMSKAHEVANLARRLQKDLRDAIADAAKYNNRERLFDMPISNVSIGYARACWGVFDYRIRIQIHGETSRRFNWQIKWLFSSEQCYPNYLFIF